MRHGHAVVRDISTPESGRCRRAVRPTRSSDSLDRMCAGVKYRVSGEYRLMEAAQPR